MTEPGASSSAGPPSIGPALWRGRPVPLPADLPHLLLLQRWRRAGLVARLTAWYVGVLAVLLFALVLFVQGALARWLDESTFHNLYGQALAVRQALESDPGEDRSLSALAARALEVNTTGMWVTVVSKDGAVVAESGAAGGDTIEPAVAGVQAIRLVNPDATPGVYWAGTFDGYHGRVAAVVFPLPDPFPARSSTAEAGSGANGGGAAASGAPAWRRLPSWAPLPLLPPLPPAPPAPPLGSGAGSAPAQLPPLAHRVAYVQVSVPTVRADQTLNAIRTLMWGGSAVALLVAAFAGLPLTRLGLRPLRLMAYASLRMARGDLTVRVQEPDSHDEVGDLARAFNLMGERLDAAFSAQQAAVVAQRAFVADASHELRSPLTALGGQLDVLPRVVRDDPEEAERLARLMRREVTRISRLVEDLLILARLDAQGAAALRIEPINLTAIARDVYEQARALPAAQGKQVVLDAPSPVVLGGDAGRLHQVLLNLTVNALEHAPEQGHVVLAVSRTDAGVVVQVRDDGPGIPPEHLPRVFDRFYRADTARGRAAAAGGAAAGGAGLGLAISRAIVEAHRGTITAANLPAGGALFTVTLPY